MERLQQRNLVFGQRLPGLSTLNSLFVVNCDGGRDEVRLQELLVGACIAIGLKFVYGLSRVSKATKSL